MHLLILKPLKYFASLLSAGLGLIDALHFVSVIVVKII